MIYICKNVQAINSRNIIVGVCNANVKSTVYPDGLFC